MQQPNNPNLSANRQPGGRGILRGCAIAVGIVFLLLTINAVYWTMRLRGNPSNAQPVAVEAEKVSAEFAALPAGEPGRGQNVFEGEAGCVACHSLQPGENRAGPSLAGIAQRAETAREGYSAGEYLYESIAYPQAHVAAGYQGNIMPGNFRQRLSAQELSDLIAFLLTR